MRFSTSLAAEPASIPAARHALERLRGHVPDLSLRNAHLLTSELVTNAVRHVGRGEVEVDVAHEDGTLRIEVRDDGEGFVPSTRARDDLGSGWGLVLLERAARRWGVADGGGRFGIWFELPG